MPVRQHFWGQIQTSGPILVDSGITLPRFLPPLLQTVTPKTPLYHNWPQDLITEQVPKALAQIGTWHPLEFPVQRLPITCEHERPKIYCPSIPGHGGIAHLAGKQRPQAMLLGLFQQGTNPKKINCRVARFIV